MCCNQLVYSHHIIYKHYVSYTWCSRYRGNFHEWCLWWTDYDKNKKICDLRMTLVGTLNDWILLLFGLHCRSYYLLHVSGWWEMIHIVIDGARRWSNSSMNLCSGTWCNHWHLASCIFSRAEMLDMPSYHHGVNLGCEYHGYTSYEKSSFKIMKWCVIDNVSMGMQVLHRVHMVHSG